MAGHGDPSAFINESSIRESFSPAVLVQAGGGRDCRGRKCRMNGINGSFRHLGFALSALGLPYRTKRR